MDDAALSRGAAPTLRPADAGDVAAITALVRDAYAPWTARIGREPWPMTQDYAQVVRDHDVTVATIDGVVVGLIVLADTPDGLLVDNVAVAPAWHGRGLGRGLLDHADAQARRRGHACTHLYTNALMSENIALYERLGYVEYAREHTAQFSRVFLRKRLG